jgi:hypothetical protein
MPAIPAPAFAVPYAAPISNILNKQVYLPRREQQRLLPYRTIPTYRDHTLHFHQLIIKMLLKVETFYYYYIFF